MCVNNRNLLFKFVSAASAADVPSSFFDIIKGLLKFAFRFRRQ